MKLHIIFYLNIFSFLFACNTLAANCYQDMNAFISNVYGEKIDLDMMDLNMQFYKDFVSPKTDEQIIDLNYAMIDEMDKIPFSSTKETTKEDIQAILDNVRSKEFIQKSCGRVNEYDPNNQVGFCFGRAMATHLEALKNRIDKQSILKLWLVGEFENAHWNHHVAVILRANDRKWYVLDPLFSRIFTTSEYVSLFNRQYGYRLAMVPTNPKRFLSAKSKLDRSYSRYNKKNLSYDFSNMEIFWKEFFTDLLKEMR